MKGIIKKLIGLPFWAKALILVIIVTVGLVQVRNAKKKTNEPQYQTTQVEKGNLIVSVNASGQVSGANSAEVSTQASGVVTNVYVKDGDHVYSGQKIADIELDLVGKQRSSQAYASYQNAQLSYDSTKANLYTAQADLFSKWQTFVKTAEGADYTNPDGSPNAQNRTNADFYIVNDNWLASEAKYKTQQKAINQSQTALGASWLSYQQSSPTVVAPISGTVTGFSLQKGTVINAQTNANGGSSSQRIASVKTDASPVISLNLTQIDAPKIKPGNKATVTLDAFSDKTFTGEVVSVDTIGSVAQGVTSYPAIIKLDSVVEGILPNMSASASIITQTKQDVLKVPSSAVTTIDGQPMVRILTNGQVTTKTVETGISSDTETEVVSGLSEGEMVVTSASSNQAGFPTRNANTQSPFSPFGRGGGFGGGGGNVIRVNR